MKLYRLSAPGFRCCRKLIKEIRMAEIVKKSGPLFDMISEAQNGAKLSEAKWKKIYYRAQYTMSKYYHKYTGI